MKLDALDHPKTLHFAALLDVSRPTAIGHLELLWAFTGKQSAQGNIGKWPDGAIARACDWMGSPEVFITALVDSKFMDRDSSHRLTVHDWSDHAPGWVRAKLKKIGLDFISSERSSERSSDDSSDNSSDGTQLDLRGGSGPPENGLRSSSEPSSRAPVLKGSEGKGSEAKRSEERESATAPPFDPSTVQALDPEAWRLWVEHRKAIKKPIRPHSMPDAAEAMAQLGDQQLAEVKRARAAGWQGLHPEKTNGARPSPTADAPRAREFPSSPRRA